MFKLEQNLMQKMDKALQTMNSKFAAPVSSKVSSSPAVPAVASTVDGYKFYGNTTALNKGKNTFYDGIDIYEATINGHTIRGQKNFLDALKKVDADLRATYNIGLTPSSGNLSTYRTWDMQNDPWIRSNGGRGFAAANPNGKYAFHMKGNAGDFMGVNAKKYQSVFHKHGLINNIPGDDHHFYIPDPTTIAGR